MYFQFNFQYDLVSAHLRENLKVVYSAGEQMKDKFRYP